MICTPYLPSDLIGGVTPATSTTRPTGADLYAGKMIYETDTTRLMIYAGGWKRLGAGLRSGRTGGVWTRAAPLTVPNYTTNNLTDIGWDNEIEDSDGFINPGPVTGVNGTIPAGLGMNYSLLVSVNWSTSALGNPGVRCVVSGAGVFDESHPAVGGVLTLPLTLALNPAQTFKFQVWQTSGVTVTATARLEIVGSGMF